MNFVGEDLVLPDMYSC